MKFLLVCLVLAAASELVHGNEYTIKAKRTYQEFPTVSGYMNMELKLKAQQDATFYQNVTESDGFQIEGNITNKKSKFYFEPFGPLEVCTKAEDCNWDCVMIYLVATNLLPDGECPAQTGTYQVDQNVEITVDLPDKIDCGDYVASVDLHRKGNWFATFEYSWTIEDDGTCEPIKK